MTASKNKKDQTVAERKHVALVKTMACSVCGQSGPSDAHHIDQSLHHLVIPLCKDCHQGSHNGIHGRKHMWLVMKKTELSCLAQTISELMYGVV